MKKSILSLIIIVILSANVLYAQEGRPQYKIRNERAGVYIGDIIIELFPYVAPLHVANFDSLVAISFYDSTAWHRVVPNFVIQGGDPNSINGPRNTWGEGDSTQATVPAEFSKVSHRTGIIGAARDTDINSATSQFYINTFNNTGLDGNYTAYGVVVEGMDVAYDIESSPRDGNDNPLEKIEMFISKLGVNESVPDVPAMISPVDGFNGFQRNTSISWSQVENAVLTFLEIARDEAFNEIVFADSFAVTGNDNSIMYSNVGLGEKTYYWRVRSNNGAKFSEYSDTRSFVTSIVPPILVSPENSSTNISVNPLLNWEPVEGAVSYRVQIVPTLPNFAESRLVFDESGITDTEVQVNGLNPNTRYYWKVACETDSYETPYSEVWLFTTESTSDVEDDKIPSEFSLSQNYPNPFNPSTTIEFTIPNAGDEYIRPLQTKLIVYDIIGREIKTLVSEHKTPGYYEINFNAENLSSGIYYYKLESGDFTQTRKMILLK